MRFLGQIHMEVKNILRSRFLLVISILVLAASVLGPVNGFIQMKRMENNDGGPVRPYAMRDTVAIKVAAGVNYSEVVAGDIVAGDGINPIVIGNISIPPENPFYWDINNLIQERSNFEMNQGGFQNPETLDLLLTMFDDLLAYKLQFAQQVNDYADYRYELAWQGEEAVVDKFIYEHIDAKTEALIEATQYRKGMDEISFRAKYIDITPAEREEAFAKVQDQIARIQNVVQNNDFPAYVTLRFEQADAQIADMQANIKIQEQAIIDNPAQEESLNAIIEDLKKQIANIEENTKPILQMRLDKNIVPGDGSWQNNAITTIENNRNQLMYTVPMTEEQFKQDPYSQQQYGTYAKYMRSIQSQINRMNNDILVAERSLNAEKPDMKFVTDGARYRTAMSLDYSMVVALFAVLLGGWLIASEFQQGTIRLLMIRPRTRTKILMGKFIAALAISFAIYFAGSLISLLLNGALFGFADFAFPNYSVSGEVSFFAYYLPRLLVCLITIVFGYAVAVMLSVVVRNTAVAVAVPIILLIGCFMVTATMGYNSAAQWLVYTPVPYVFLYQFFTPSNMFSYMFEYTGTQLNVMIGIAYFAAITLISMATSVIVFKNRDITN